ncbi:GNAT family N-acetyltransferase [Pseudomonas sp. EL_65y_Pfl2_R95]|uniref:GNAT family N-acetyltransferase n=1 Tax=Pseudomonas sp. EL_65y_Pfl2_R95 TaxID=3088698 RepID=UPI004040A40F
MDLHISSARLDDVLYASELVQKNMRPYYVRHVLTWSRDDFLAAWKTLENYSVFKGQFQVGFFSLSEQAGDLYIRDLQLSAACTGQGVGTWILSQITGMATQRNCRSIRLKVFADNPAISLYGRAGFDVVGREPNLLRMELRIACR